MVYDQSGSYTALAGVIVGLLAHFNINTTVNDVLTVIGAVVCITGIVKQYIAHRKVAIQAGMIVPKR